jgi:uncharacterized protein (DUF169 family)
LADLNSISKDLIEHLELRYAPVGITLFREGERKPAETPFCSDNLKSYCQALVLGGEGRTLLLKKEQMGCKLGTSVLGMEDEMEAFLDDGVLEKYGVGLFATEEASAETLLKSTYLPKGKTKSVLIAPLHTLADLPQVVAFTANSEQVMWLLYALNYERGGRQDLPQSGGALGGCADITAWPLLEGQPNVTFLGLGCRIKSAIDSCHLMLGLPGSLLEPLHTHILNMAKPIAMLRNARSKNT